MQQDDKLQSLRQEIDAIDDQIIALLKTRMQRVDQVGQHKRSVGTDGCFLKPGREAHIVKRVIEALQPEFPASAVASIWRMIISASLNREQSLAVSVYEDEMKHSYWLAREYFGSFIPVTQHRNVGSVLSDVEKSNSVLGVLPLASGEKSSHQWWQNLDKKVSVFACLPSVQEMPGQDGGEQTVMILGKVCPEATGNDSTLLVINASINFSRSNVNKVFQDLNMNTVWLSEAITPGESDIKDHLLRLDGFLSAKDERFQLIQKGLKGKINHCRLVGSYANPIVVQSLRKNHAA